MNHTFTRTLFAVLVLCLFSVACEKPEDKVLHENREEFTVEEQASIGNNLSRLMGLHSNIYNKLSVDENEEFYEYINTILATVVNTAQVETRNDFGWQVIILKDDEKKAAFSIPGGKVYITTGLLKAIEGENELFSLLAHEVYYAEKDAVLQLMIEEYGVIPVNDLALGTDSQHAIDIARSIQDIVYSPETVSKADNFVMELICPFQYNALGLKSFIERIKMNFDSISWLETRPSSLSRINFIEEKANACGAEEPTFAERYEYKKGLLP